MKKFLLFVCVVLFNGCSTVVLAEETSEEFRPSLVAEGLSGSYNDGGNFFELSVLTWGARNQPAIGSRLFPQFFRVRKENSDDVSSIESSLFFGRDEYKILLGSFYQGSDISGQSTRSSSKALVGFSWLAHPQRNSLLKELTAKFYFKDDDIYDDVVYSMGQDNFVSLEAVVKKGIHEHIQLSLDTKLFREVEGDGMGVAAETKIRYGFPNQVSFLSSESFILYPGLSIFAGARYVDGQTPVSSGLSSIDYFTGVELVFNSIEG